MPGPPSVLPVVAPARGRAPPPLPGSDPGDHHRQPRRVLPDQRRRGHPHPAFEEPAVDRSMTDARPTIRRQLSLYVPPDAARQLEAVRRVLDPVQSRLIPAHVTLCREDELARVSGPELESRLGDARLKPVTLHFGGPEG